MGGYFDFLIGSQQHILLGIVFAGAALGGELLKPFAVSQFVSALASFSVVRALACLALAVVCIVYSFTAELSLAAGSRGDLAASREAVVDAQRDARADRQRAEGELASLQPTRPAAELQAEIDGLLLTPAAKGCTKIDGAVQERICPKVATLKTEKARAEDVFRNPSVLPDFPTGVNAILFDARSRSRRESDEDLAADVGFGLKKARIKLPVETCRLIGTVVVAHLRLAGWQFRRKPPTPPHSAGSQLVHRIGSARANLRWTCNSICCEVAATFSACPPRDPSLGRSSAPSLTLGAFFFRRRRGVTRSEQRLAPAAALRARSRPERRGTSQAASAKR